MKSIISVKKDYLVLPTSEGAADKELVFSCDGERESAVVRLDYFAPENNVYYPIGRFRGKDVTIESSPDIAVKDIQADEPDYGSAGDYPYRPKWHFAPLFGWNNDPNGLFVRELPTGEKEYHMFFQYNPYGTDWANMHWGHAVSGDLLEWRELPIALRPDCDGTMYSGCAVIDRENRSGLARGDEPTIVLLYTCAGGTSAISRGKGYTQCVAFSTDGGRTFEKYGGNPVIGELCHGNRDPKAEWCEELGRYVMALYMTDADFMLFSSPDLLHWDKLQSIRLDGDTEFPDFFPLWADGRKYWVLMGGRHRYLVTEWTGSEFRAVQEPRTLGYGRNIQAPQTFSGMTDGRRVAISWERRMPFPRPRPIASQMSVPYELKLLRRTGGLYLSAAPISEYERFCRPTYGRKNITLNSGGALTVPLSTVACDITLKFGEGSDDVAITLFGQKIEVSVHGNMVTTKDGITMPLSLPGGEKSLRIISDSCSLELFSGEGTSVTVSAVLCDPNLPYMSISSINGAAIEELTVREFIDKKR